MTLETQLRDRFAAASSSIDEPEPRLDTVVRRGTRRRRTSQAMTAIGVIAVVSGGIALASATLAGGRSAPVVGTPADGGPSSTPAADPGRDEATPEANPGTGLADERYRWVVWPVLADAAATDGAQEPYQSTLVGTAEAIASELIGRPAQVSRTLTFAEPDGDGVWVLAEGIDDTGKARAFAVLVEEIDGAYWVLHAQDRADVTVDVERVGDELVVSGNGPAIGGGIAVSVEATVDGSSTVLGTLDAEIDAANGTFRATFEIPPGTSRTAAVYVAGRTQGVDEFEVLTARDIGPGASIRAPFESLPEDVAKALPAGAGIAWFLWIVGALVGVTVIAAWRHERRRRRSTPDDPGRGTGPGTAVEDARGAWRVIQTLRGGPGASGG